MEPAGVCGAQGRQELLGQGRAVLGRGGPVPRSLSPHLLPHSMDRRCADLESSLKHLGKAELKEFKVKLNKYKPQGGFQPVLWSELESADTLDIVRVLRGHFVEPYALQVAADIMALINKKDLESTLRQAHDLISIEAVQLR
ncbi:NACHT, LRR and PYD domains-containing protein 3-like isoform X3 [Alligator mississippiensis]|uniref:NACHT, LRR and PYD domains-containing protein 3-like isoform X3 n=2 Tax=Alligator mississippiensis TaxID=8496 RepID=UPI0028781382|nr:NACHT, LRR and PYD domains-containing protein 3-like isoform X3 [Alligator mississippiensis]